MKISTLIISYFLCVSIANAVEMGIVTGSETGTYIKIGKDIANLVKKKDVKLNVYPSSGSLLNLGYVYKRKGVQLGIVQSDAINYIRSNSKDSANKKRIVNSTRMVFPLYNEEIHILASNSISDFESLEGKKVAVGKEGSGTAITAKLLFQITKVNPAERVSVGGKEALDQLTAGKIDAMIYVSGFPVELFNRQIPKVHLLNIENKGILDYYPSSKIPAKTYPFQAKAVETATVKALLISHDYKGTNCQNVANLAKIIYDNFDTLKKEGHPKWKTVDLDFKMPKWEQYGCVTDILNKKPSSKKDKGCDENAEARALCDMLK